MADDHALGPLPSGQCEPPRSRRPPLSEVESLRLWIARLEARVERLEATVDTASACPFCEELARVLRPAAEDAVGPGATEDEVGYKLNKLMAEVARRLALPLTPCGVRYASDA